MRRSLASIDFELNELEGELKEVAATHAAILERIDALEEEKSALHTPAPFECPFCDHLFETKDKMCVHVKIHMGPAAQKVPKEDTMVRLLKKAASRNGSGPTLRDRLKSVLAKGELTQEAAVKATRVNRTIISQFLNHNRALSEENETRISKWVAEQEAKLAF